MAITLNSKVYNWAQFDSNGTGRWIHSPDGVPNANSMLTAKVTSNGKAQKVTWKLTVPTVAIDDSACGCEGAVLRTAYLTITADFANTSNATERADDLQRLQDLTENAQFIASISSLLQPQG